MAIFVNLSASAMMSFGPVALALEVRPVTSRTLFGLGQFGQDARHFRIVWQTPPRRLQRKRWVRNSSNG